MGEYAQYNGSDIKLGTCENMYYLRADQRHLIDGYKFALDIERFRFPFPDEDDVEAGAFKDHSRGVRIPGWSLPATLSGDEHGSVQFTSSAGYVLSIPCPEQFGTPGIGPVDVEGVNVHRNGFNGYPVVRQQALRGGVWVTLVSCGACGCLHRLDTLEDAEPVIEAFRNEAAREQYRAGTIELANSETHRAFLLEMASRIEAGYFVREMVPA
jgi:hypothetical protein